MITNEYCEESKKVDNDVLAKGIVLSQRELMDEFNKENPNATQLEKTAFAFGIIKMGSRAIKIYEGLK